MVLHLIQDQWKAKKTSVGKHIKHSPSDSCGEVGPSPSAGLWGLSSVWGCPRLWEIPGTVPSALAAGQRQDFPHDNNAHFYTFPSTPTSRERGGMARRGFYLHPGRLYAETPLISAANV